MYRCKQGRNGGHHNGRGGITRINNASGMTDSSLPTPGNGFEERGPEIKRILIDSRARSLS